jgi:hypothetical protein
MPVTAPFYIPLMNCKEGKRERKQPLYSHGELCFLPLLPIIEVSDNGHIVKLKSKFLLIKIFLTVEGL